MARLPGGARDVMALLREAGDLSTGDVLAALEVSRPSAISLLRAMEAAGLVEWVGKSAKDPRAYWKTKVE